MSDRKLQERVAYKLRECGLKCDDYDVSVEPGEITVQNAHEVTFEMLEKIAMYFGTRKINLGHEGGYYGSRYSTLTIIEPSENWTT